MQISRTGGIARESSRCWITSIKCIFSSIAAKSYSLQQTSEHADEAIAAISVFGIFFSDCASCLGCIIPILCGSRRPIFVVSAPGLCFSHSRYLVHNIVQSFAVSAHPGFMGACSPRSEQPKKKTTLANFLSFKRSRVPA